MKKSLKEKLVKIMKKRQTKDDPSHDFQHILRVTNVAEKIAKKEKADLDIVIAAALFHDIVVYRKDSPNSKNETEESAQLAIRILKRIKEYPKEKIENVATCIRQCSFSKGIIPELLESKILQDADRLEATGSISIMRTFSSGGQMNRHFYDEQDPFREKNSRFGMTGIDLFYMRLLVVEKRMYTKQAKEIAKRRTKFLKNFLAELKKELKESNII